jgi:ABC-type sugar transport system ATPase subunit
VLLVSAELDEVLELSDRVAVMYRGQLVAVVDGRTADRNEVGVLMATGARQEAAIASGAITGTQAAEEVSSVEATVDATSDRADPPAADADVPNDVPPAAGGSDA